MLTAGVWALAIIMAILGVTIMLQIDELENILRLMDVACY